MDQWGSDSRRLEAREKDSQDASPSPFVPAPPRKANHDHRHTKNEDCILHIKIKAIYGI